MLASAETVSPPASTTLYFDPLYDLPPLGRPCQASFKKHKNLPHPRNHRPALATRSSPSRDHYSIDTASNPKLKAEPSTSTLKDDSRSSKAPGPSLPPTPPAHSRTSSGSHSIQPSSPTYIGTPVQSGTNTSIRTIPGTPPHQRSPPTPDVTPPQPERRSRPFRPNLTDRIPSKANTDSRSESFKTARESPDPSEEDEKLMTSRRVLSSSRTSQSTVKRANDTRQRKASEVGLGLGLESDDSLTPRTKQEFFTFDGEWGSTSEVEQEWDDNYNRNVIVRKRRGQAKSGGRQEEVIEDVTITPTNATKALRSMPLSERTQAQPSPSPQEFTNRDKHATAPSTSESSVSTDVRRSSGMSSKSTVSTVVEALLVDVTPQRQKTLRHVRKQTALRDSGSDFSPSSSSASTSLRQVESTKRSRPPVSNDATRRVESFASNGTVNSISSRKARREVWKNGGIPVVVIPDRKASMKSTAGPPSLRSTSSHRSKRSNSLSSAPLSSHSKAKDLTPYFDKPSRRGRSMSESDGSIEPGSIVPEQLTMDYPPIVPLRKSSLSAPTSRNGSRAGSQAGSRASSLTAESLKAHNTFLEQDPKQQQQPPKITVERAPRTEHVSNRSDQRQLQPAPSVESHKDALPDHRPPVDQNEDPFGKRPTTHNTPFSQASVETNGTQSAADISEAMAVNIYPHQNKSVLMVHHMSKPADPVTAANALQWEESAQTGQTTATEKDPDNPKITASGPDGGPVTPPQLQLSMDDVDSPLRNPRAPPEPPAIKFIPATPSGLTPTGEEEKMLGNYFEEIQRRPSLMRRAFSLRKSSENVPARPGFLARTLSLTRAIRRETAENPALGKREDNSVGHQRRRADAPPPDESKLHPFWRPASEYDGTDEDEDDDWVRDVRDVPDEVDQIYRYPPIDNRPPAGRRRSLSERMKRTFAILPIDSEEHYTTAPERDPERRTIKRTPSGNLRVMKYRDSYSSLRWSLSPSHSPSRPTSSHHHHHHHDNNDDDDPHRPSTAPDRNNSNRRVWGVTTTTTEKRFDAQGRRLFPGWQDKLAALDQYRPANLQRRLSEHRRLKRTRELRQKISGPREVRDGVGEVVKRNSYKGPSYQTPSMSMVGGDAGSAPERYEEGGGVGGGDRREAVGDQSRYRDRAIEYHQQQQQQQQRLQRQHRLQGVELDEGRHHREGVQI
ncbi:hypothetical protein F4779DRAFT_14630 [Xylariaceae sp. FL0662B]|nr:hypothetical protein F4779DRAFT_14630 [Xylariaceae sp. FL0662B]